MARSRINRRWTFALWAFCLLAATAGPLTGAGPAATPTAAAPAAVGMLSATADPAVLPARIGDDVRAATHNTPLRGLLLAALLGSLLALPAALRRRASAFQRDHRPLRARRHAIALRAPPLQLA